MNLFRKISLIMSLFMGISLSWAMEEEDIQLSEASTRAIANSTNLRNLSSLDLSNDPLPKQESLPTEIIIYMKKYMSFGVISVFSRTSMPFNSLLKGELENFKNIMRPNPPIRRTGKDFFGEVAKMDDPRYLPYLWDEERLYFIAEEMNSLNLMRAITHISPSIMCLHGTLSDVLKCIKKTNKKIKRWYVFMSCNDDIVEYYMKSLDGEFKLQYNPDNSLISAVARHGKLKYLKYCPQYLLDCQLEVMEELAIKYKNKNVIDFIKIYRSDNESRHKTDFIMECVNSIEKN